MCKQIIVLLSGKYASVVNEETTSSTQLKTINFILYQKRRRHLGIWNSLGNQQSFQADCILVSRQKKSSVLDSHSYHDAETWIRTYYGSARTDNSQETAFLQLYQTKDLRTINVYEIELQKWHKYQGDFWDARRTMISILEMAKIFGIFPLQVAGLL